MKIPITKPFFGSEELQAIQKPLETGWVVQGPFVKQFEDAFAAFTRAKFAGATTSCTTALHIAVAALELNPGDEVIVPAFTWVATANAVEYLGAKPIFCDIDLATFNIDVKQIESKITPRTVGIIPVHLFGLGADMDPILAIAMKRKLWVVEDAACSFGGWYRGKHTGTFGKYGCFSFHPRKSITTGEGGMVTTDSEDLDRLVRTLRDHGASRSDLERHQSKAAFLLPEYRHLGFNFRMTDMQGAMGCAQMARASWILEQRTRWAQAYDKALAGLSSLGTPKVPKDYIHGYQAYVTLFQPEAPSLSNASRLHDQRNKLMSSLEAKGISTRQGTHAAALQAYYVDKYGIRKEDVPCAYMADKLSMALPLYPQMTSEEHAAVVQSLKQGLKEL